MQTSTIACPSIGTEAYFTFKEPVARSLQNRLGTSATQILLKVAAINEIKEMMQSELRDPFLEAYAPAGIEQSQYNQDLIDNIQILTFRFTAPDGSVKYVRVPMTLVQGYDSVAEIVYLDKTLVLGLGPQHRDLNLLAFHADLIGFLKSRTGITAQVREVSMGDPINITSEEHDIREALRQSEIYVNKTDAVELEELRLKYQNVINRLNELGISLG